MLGVLWLAGTNSRIEHNRRSHSKPGVARISCGAGDGEGSQSRAVVPSGALLVNVSRLLPRIHL